jgi:acyl carrier protein
MTEAEIYRGLTEIFHDIFDDDTLVLKPEMTAAAIPEWDSHNHISIIVAAEMRFGVKFQTAEIESMRNVGELVRCIERKVGRQQG